MIQYPKQEHVTLPSVESWNTNMNILRDPPKALWTRKIDKVSQTQEITRLIGEENGDRICEMIKVYPRGINPMVAVSYSNYGTNGGQNRNFTGAGLFGGDKACCDGRSAIIGQAKLPYQLIDNGDFRPPIFRQEDLMPLSRLPRTNTSAWTQKGFISYANAVQCPKAKEIRQIQDPIRTSIRPTATIDIQTPLVEPFELRQVLTNPIITSVSSGIRTMDRTQKNNSNVSGIIKDALQGSLRTNHSANGIGTQSIQDINPENYTTDIVYSNVRTNEKGEKLQLLSEKTGNQQSVKDLLNFPTNSGFDRPNAQPLSDNIPHELVRTVPRHKHLSAKSRDIHIRNVESKPHSLERKLPRTFINSNLGGFGLGADSYSCGSRNKKLKLKISPAEGFSGKATIPKMPLRRSTQFRTGGNKMNILRRINYTQGARRI